MFHQTNEKPSPLILAKRDGNKIHITLLYDEDSSHFIDFDAALFNKLTTATAKQALRDAARRLDEWAKANQLRPGSAWGTAAGISPNAFGIAEVNRDDLRQRGPLP